MSATQSSMLIIGREWNFQRDDRRNSKHLDPPKTEVRLSPTKAEPTLNRALIRKTVAMYADCISRQLL